MSNKFFPATHSALLLLLALVPAVSAEVIVLKDGGSMQGDVEKVTDEHVVLSSESGKVKTRVRFREMTVRSQYRIRKRYDEPESAGEHLELGQFARENRLYPQAREQFRRVIATAEKEALRNRAKELLDELDREHASHLFDRAKKLQEEGKHEEALRVYQDLQVKFPDSEFADRASEKVRNLAGQLAAQIKKKKKQQKQQVKKARKKKRKQYLEALKKKLALARENLSDALSLEADDEPKEAFKRYDRADELLRNLRSSIRTNFSAESVKNLPDDFRKVMEKANRLLVRSYAQRAGLYGVRGQVHQGLKWVNRALAIDPSHSQAQKLKNIFTEHMLLRSLDNFPRRR